MLSWGMGRLRETAVPSRWHWPQTKGTFSGTTAERGSFTGTMSWFPWQFTQWGARVSPRAIALPWSDRACCSCSVVWQVPHFTCAGVSWGKSFPSRSAWQPVHPKLPCTEVANFLPSTYSETVLPARVVVIVLSPWQARHSAPGGSAAWARYSENSRKQAVARRVATIILRPADHLLRATFASTMANSRAHFINALRLGRPVPRGLKPAFFSASGGTAEAVPFPFVLEPCSRMMQDGASPVSTRHFSASCEAVPYPTPIRETSFRQCLLHAQIRKHFRVFLLNRQQIVAGTAIVGDGLAVGTGMTAVMAAEAAWRIVVPKIIRVDAPGHTHGGKDVAQIDVCHFLASLLHHGAPRLIDLRVIGAIEI